MKKIYRLIVLLGMVLCLMNGMHGQTAPGGYGFASTISDSLSAPVRMALDNMDNLYVTDAIHKKINRYNAAGTYSGSIVTGGSPISIAINNANAMYIGDGENGKIYKLNSNGTTTELYSGTVFPSSMVFCPDGLLYVSDSKLQRVIVLDLSGNVVRTIGAGTLICPTGITYDKKNDRILVAEHGGIGTGFNPVIKVRIYSLTGTLITSFGSHGNGDGKFYRIQGLAVGRCGEIYVPEPYQGNVSVFSENTMFLTRFGQYGDSTSQLRVPLDIAINSQDKIFISAENNGTIEVFNIDYLLPTSNISCGNKTICAGSSTEIPVLFTGTAPWTFTYTVNGATPVTVTGTGNNPYLLTASAPGNYQVTALSDASHAGTCFSGNSVITVDSIIPTASFTIGEVSFCPGQATIIPVEFTGTPPWTFSYTINGVNPKTISNVTSTPYLLTVSEPGMYAISSLSGSGCTGSNFTGNVIVHEGIMPTATITTGNTSICSGSATGLAVGFTGTPPWSFTYTVNDSSETTLHDIIENPYQLNVFQAGKYKITHVQDATCFSDVTAVGPEITVIPLPTANISSPDISVCTGSSSSIIIDLAGTAPWSFTCTRDGVDPVSITGITTSTYLLPVSVAGTYQLTAVSDAHCTGTSVSGSSTLTLNPLPVVSLGPAGALCQGDSLVLDPGQFALYFWSDSTYTRTLTARAAGTYTVSVTDYNGCTNSASKMLSELTVPSAAFASGDISLCAGETADLSVILTGLPPWSFTYTVNGANPHTIGNVTSSPYMLNVFEPGLYRIVEVIDMQCHSTVSSGTPLITVHSIPTYNFSSGNASFCAGQSVSLVVDFTGTPPWSFTYTVNGINSVTVNAVMASPFTIPVSMAGTYEIVALSDAFCVGRIHAGTVIISENPLPVINLGPDATIVSGETLSLDPGQSFAGYLWSDGSTGSTLDVVSAGTYAVTVTDYNGCTNSDVIEVAVTIPVNTVIQGVTITGTQCFNATQTITIAGKGGAFVVQSGGSATLIAGRSILFQYGAMVDQGGYMHAYITTDNTYCGGNTPPVVAMPNPVAAVQADSDSALSSNPDVFRTNAVAGRVDYGFKLYPNPSAGLVNIEVKNPDNPELRITIKDMAGRQVYVKTIQHPRFTEQIDLGRFIHGIYLVELTSGSHSGIFKLVLLD